MILTVAFNFRIECAIAAVSKRLYAGTDIPVRPIARMTVFPPGQVALWKRQA